MNATYFDQEEAFHSPSLESVGLPIALIDPSLRGTEENFWIMDAQLSYRLPHRRGIISLSANNLLEETSRLRDTDHANPTFFPERTFLLRVSLSF